MPRSGAARAGARRALHPHVAALPLLLALAGAHGCVPHLEVRDAGAEGGGADGGGACAFPGPPAATLPAPPLVLGTAVMGSLSATGASNNRVFSCGRAFEEALQAAAGPENAYTLSVSARTGVALALDRTDVPDGGVATAPYPVALIRGACADPATEQACVVHAPDRYYAGRTRVALDPGSYFVLVDAIQDPGAMPAGLQYRLNLTTFTPAANAECATPATLSPGTPRAGQRTGEGLQPRGYCPNSFADVGRPLLGPRLYYSVSVPAQSALHVTATTQESTQDDSLNIQVLEDCAHPDVCRDSAWSSGGVAARASAVAYNTDNFPRSFLVAVSAGLSGSDAVTFTLDASTATSAYTVTTQSLSSMCDDLPASDALPLDVFSTALVALPVPIRYFGATATHFAASAQGYLQLFTDGGGMAPSAAITNGNLPSTNAPPGMLAPFWDPSVGSFPPPTGLRAARIAASASVPAHYTIAWQEYPHSGVESSSLSFQVQLFDSGEIDYVYCHLAGSNARVLHGGNAVVGLQSIASDQAIVTSFHAEALSEGMTIQFVPR